ncbi:MAG: ABC transporter [Micromonosporaceae bacterium]|nr:ABC transporter [Micromonosporaceae bacterium]
MPRRPAMQRRPVRRVEARPDAKPDGDAWWARIPAVAHLLREGLDLPDGVTFLVGENGSGKSTVVEAVAMAYGLNPEGGSVYARHRTRPTESALCDALRLVRSPYRAHAYFLRAETSHGLYTYLESAAGTRGAGEDAKLHERSHGEGFLDLLRRKFDGYGFYLMDEPEAPLSFTSTLSLLSTLDSLRAAGAQVVVATHSPVLTALPGAHILELGGHGIRRVAWSELELVGHWRRYLTEPASYLDRLLAGSD